MHHYNVTLPTQIVIKSKVVTRVESSAKLTSHEIFQRKRRYCLDSAHESTDYVVDGNNGVHILIDRAKR